MKRNIFIITIISTCLMMTSCESQNVKDAKEAFSNEDYVKVIECLETEDNISDDVSQMLHISRAHMAIENNEFLEAYKEIMQIESPTEEPAYEEIRGKLVTNALEAGNAKDIIEAIKLDQTLANFAADEIIKACDELNYNGFIVLEDMNEGLEDGEMKSKLQDYFNANKTNKPKAFIIGKWEPNDDPGSIANFEIKKTDDELIGIVTETYREPFLVGDVYWKDFSFLEENQFKCTTLTKGDGVGTSTAIVDIDYGKEIMHAHHTSNDFYDLEAYDSYWKRSK